jgi:hypothetical protein
MKATTNTKSGKQVNRILTEGKDWVMNHLVFILVAVALTILVAAPQQNQSHEVQHHSSPQVVSILVGKCTLK